MLKKLQLMARIMNEKTNNTQFHTYDNYDVCIFCGCPVPEGKMVCPKCEEILLSKNNKNKKISKNKKDGKTKESAVKRFFYSIFGKNKAK